MKRKTGYHVLWVLFLVVISCKQKDYREPSSLDDPSSQVEWQSLLDDELSQWQPWLGTPHKSSNIEGYEDVEEVREGVPLGLSNRNKVFSVEEEHGEKVLKVTGEIFGSLMSKSDYQNYHLKFDVKWGNRLWEPMIDRLRNNGMLYHSIGEPGKGLWNTWMTSLEFEVEHTNFGDFITINFDGNVVAQCPAVEKGGKFYFDADVPLVNVGWKRYGSGRVFKNKDLERPMGEWTSLELVCFNNMALHIVEGEVVMAVYNPQFYDGNKWIPMNKGKLQIQSEGAETYFKNIQIKHIDSLEQKFQKYIR